MGHKTFESDLQIVTHFVSKEYKAATTPPNSGVNAFWRVLSLQKINFDLQGVKSMMAPHHLKVWVQKYSTGEERKQRELRCWAKCRWLASFALLNFSCFFSSSSSSFSSLLVCFFPFFLFLQQLHLLSTYYLLGVVLNTYHIYYFIWLMSLFLRMVEHDCRFWAKVLAFLRLK